MKQWIKWQMKKWQVIAVAFDWFTRGATVMTVKTSTSHGAAKALIAAAVCGWALTADTSQATTLNFAYDSVDQVIQGDTTSGGAADLLHNYGSASGAGVTGFNTPNISVEWGLSLGPNGDRWFTLSSFNNGVGHYAPFGTAGQAILPSTSITFTGTGGYFARLDSIVLEHVAAGTQTNTLRVNVDGNISDFTTIVGSTTPITVNLASAGAGSVVTLTYQSVTPLPGAWVFDDLTFSQVPEPATGALLALGGLLLRRKRVGETRNKSE